MKYKEIQSKVIFIKFFFNYVHNQFEHCYFLFIKNELNYSFLEAAGI